MEFPSVWIARKILSKGHLLKTFDKPILISKSLNPTEQAAQRKALIKRKELIQQRVDPKELRKRNLKLYHNNDLVPTD